jgi:hypothetical protein
LVADCLLNDQEWQELAEIEAILRVMNTLAMSSQREDPGWISFSWFEVVLAKAKLFSNKNPLKIFDTSVTWSPDVKIKDIPIIAVETDSPLLSETAKTLISRINDEFKNYFPIPDSDQLIAINVHPVMVSMGLGWLKLFDKENFSKKGIEENRSKTIDFIADLYRGTIKQHEQVEAIEKQVSISEDAPTNVDNESCTPSPKLEDDFLKIFLQQSKSEEEPEDEFINSDEKEAIGLKKLKEEITAEYTDFVNFCTRIDWLRAVKKFPTKRFENVSKEDFHEKIYELKDPVFTGSVFDVLKWWKQEGIERFPKIATAAMILLGKPYSNGFQERIFSTGTWTDAKLRQKLTYGNLELSVLDKINNDKCSRLLSAIGSLKYEESQDASEFVSQFFALKHQKHEDILTMADMVDETFEPERLQNEEVYEDSDDEEFPVSTDTELE